MGTEETNESDKTVGNPMDSNSPGEGTESSSTVENPMLPNSPGKETESSSTVENPMLPNSSSGSKNEDDSAFEDSDSITSLIPESFQKVFNDTLGRTGSEGVSQDGASNSPKNSDYNKTGQSEKKGKEIVELAQELREDTTVDASEMKEQLLSSEDMGEYSFLVNWKVHNRISSQKWDDRKEKFSISKITGLDELFNSEFEFLGLDKLLNPDLYEIKEQFGTPMFEYIRDRKTEGWIIHSVEDERVVLRKPQDQSIFWHTVTGITTGAWTLGLGNVAYSELQEHKRADMKVVRPGNLPQEYQRYSEDEITN